MSEQPKCLNCGTPLAGRWCHGCGQKRLEPQDRTLTALLHEFVGALTNLDGRVARSFTWLVFRPGRFAGDYLHGIRGRYLSPITLFLTVNVLYFFAPSLTDFNLPLADHLDNQPHSGLAAALVEGRLDARGMALVEYAARFNAEEANLAKLLILLHVPLLALGLQLLHGRRALFADHMLLAFLFMAFLLLHLQLTPWLLLVVARILQVQRFPHIVLSVSLLLPLVAWAFFALRGAVRQPAWLAAVRTPLVIAAAMAAHFVYRAILFLVTFART